MVIPFILFVFILVVGLLFTRLSSGMPLVATCGAAINAACHRPEEDSDVCLLPVQCGVVSDETTLPSHCSFTTYRLVREPEEGKYYV
jgi:hypothetical protein